MNAIILAAGKGTRLAPLTRDIPKPLVKINGQPIIERQIECLLARGIYEIYIVVGYLCEQFSYLKDKYNVKLVYNQSFDIYNNIYSMGLCSKYLGDTYVLEGDIYLNRNFLDGGICKSSYFSGIKRDIQQEWILEFDERVYNVINVCANTFEGERCPREDYIMCGVSFWTGKVAAIIKQELDDRMELLLEDRVSGIGDQYWDQIVVDNLKILDVGVRKIASDDWFEIDKWEDLALAESFMGRSKKYPDINKNEPNHDSLFLL